MYKNIKSFESACKALNLDPKSLPEVKNVPKKHQQAIIAHYKLITIVEAVNEGWSPNWNDSDEYKYYPWFKVTATKKSKSGSGLVYGRYDCFCADSIVGSRLCLQTREKAEYVAKKFKKLYEQYFLYQ
jgi:hypothetical protein